MSRELWNRWRRHTVREEPPEAVAPELLAAWLDNRGDPDSSEQIERLVAADPDWLDVRETPSAPPVPAELVARARDLVPDPRETEAQGPSWWSGLRVHIPIWRPIIVGAPAVALALWLGASMGSAVVENQRSVDMAISAVLNPGFQAPPVL